MLKKTNIVLGLVVAGLFGLTACSKYTTEPNKVIETTLDVAETAWERSHIPDTPMVTDTVSARNDIWLGADSIKITEGDPLPMWAEKSDGITLAIAENATLPQVADEISELTGIDVRIDDLKATDTVPTESIAINYSGKLSGLFNYLAKRYNVWWKYKGGVVSFFTKETRVFTVYALPTESKMSSELSGSTSGDAKSSSSLSTSAELSLWNSIEEGVKQVLGSDGEVSFSRPTGTITVTAAPYMMRKVASYINTWNDKMSRQVAIAVKVLTVTLSDTNSYGLDLTAAFKSSRVGVNFLSAANGIVSVGNPGTLSMALVDESSKWNGSGGIIQALSTQGKTAVVTTSTVTTLNNKVAPVQITTSQNYVKETTVTTTGSGTDATVETEINTDTLNYGYTMEILPRILDHGRLIMLFTLSLTDLLELKSFTSGGSSSDDSSDSDTSTSDDTTSSDNSTDQTTVQLPKMQMRGFMQEIAMRSGSTLILTGFENTNTATQTAGIGQPNISILGGSVNSTKERTVMVILITPEVLESPLSAEARMYDF